MDQVVCDVQALDAPTGDQAVADDSHALDCVDGLAFVQRHAFEVQALLATALAHRLVSQLVQPVHALVVDRRVFRSQQVGDAPVAVRMAACRSIRSASSQGADGVLDHTRLEHIDGVLTLSSAQNLALPHGRSTSCLPRQGVREGAFRRTRLARVGKRLRPRGRDAFELVRLG